MGGRSGGGREGRGDLNGRLDQPDSKPPRQPDCGGEEHDSARQAKNDAAQLLATVERLERELNAVKAGAGMGGGGLKGMPLGGEGFGLSGGNKGVSFGGGAATAAGVPWMAGGMAGGVRRAGVWHRVWCSFAVLVYHAFFAHRAGFKSFLSTEGRLVSLEEHVLPLLRQAVEASLVDTI